MKKYSIVLILITGFLLTGNARAEGFSGSVDHDTTLTKANGPYHITGNTTFTAHLTIDPGTEIIFDGDYTLTVNGLLTAAGTVKDSIYFHYKNGVKKEMPFSLPSPFKLSSKFPVT